MMSRKIQLALSSFVMLSLLACGSGSDGTATSATATDKKNGGFISDDDNPVKPSKSQLEDEEYSTEYTDIHSGRIRDSRDGASYKTVTIGTQTWMAENLNYKASLSRCYDNESANCEKYGRLYFWLTAVGEGEDVVSILRNEYAEDYLDTRAEIAKKYWNKQVQGICPPNWRLPQKEDFEKLVEYVGGKEIALGALRTADWTNKQGEAFAGTDDYGFSLLPAGSGFFGGSASENGFRGLGWYATLWTSTVVDEEDGGAYSMKLAAKEGLEIEKDFDGWFGMHSVRCILNASSEEKDEDEVDIFRTDY